MKKTVEDYKKKLNLLKKYDEFYYEFSKPKVSDADYDNLKKELLEFERENKEFTFVSNKIGFAPSKKFSKVKHLEKCYLWIMLLLSKMFKIF